jgi:molybdate transport repressor ModE-like protein
MSRPSAQTFTQQQLRVFAAVAEQRSLSGAARALGMAEPTVYGHLDTLERLVGSPLVTRTRGSRQSTLTEAGAMLLPTVSSVLETWDRGVQAVREQYGSDRRTITVGSMPHFGTYILPRLVERFTRERPDVTVRIQIGRILPMVERIKARQVDLAVCFGPVNDNDLRQELFDHTELVIVGPTCHRLAGRKTVPFSELANERLITTDPVALSPGEFITRMAEERGVPLNIVMTSSDIQPRIQSMLGGLGIGPVYVDSVEPELESGQLCILPIEGFPIRVQRVILSPLAEMPTAAQDFREHLLRNRPAIGARTFLAARHAG